MEPKYSRRKVWTQPEHNDQKASMIICQHDHMTDQSVLGDWEGANWGVGEGRD